MAVVQPYNRRATGKQDAAPRSSDDSLAWNVDGTAAEIPEVSSALGCTSEGGHLCGEHKARHWYGSTRKSRHPAFACPFFFAQLGVLGFGLLVDEKTVIGILASRQEVFIELALGGLAARKPLSPGHLQSC